jgi:hypothetical protein
VQRIILIYAVLTVWVGANVLSFFNPQFVVSWWIHVMMGIALGFLTQTDISVGGAIPVKIGSSEDNNSNKKE